MEKNKKTLEYMKLTEKTNKEEGMLSADLTES